MDLEVGECSHADGDFLLQLNDSGEDLEYAQSVAGARGSGVLGFVPAPRTHPVTAVTPPLVVSLPQGPPPTKDWDWGDGPDGCVAYFSGAGAPHGFESKSSYVGTRIPHGMLSNSLLLYERVRLSAPKMKSQR